MKNDLFVLHHVGGRNGYRAFPLVPALEHEFISVMYEAAEDGNDQIIEVSERRSGCKTILVNACVGKQMEMRNFNLNRDPYTSSLLHLNPKFQMYYCEHEKYDYVIGDVISPVNRVVLSTESLDDLIRSKNLSECDFLSLDTQGSELEILEGADDTLASCVGVELEVSFVELYSGQPLFGDIDRHLKLKGFEFIKFRNVLEWAPQACSNELRGDKMHFQADALYFKSPKDVAENQRYKLLFTSLVFGQTEFAYSVALEMRRTPSVAEKRDWIKFCDKFLELSVGGTSNRLGFGDFYSVEQSYNRFNSNKASVSVVKKFDQPTENLYKTVRKSVYRALAICLGPIFVKHLVRFRARMRLKWSKETGIEKLFHQVGLSDVASKIKFSRLKLQGKL